MLLITKNYICAIFVANFSAVRAKSCKYTAFTPRQIFSIATTTLSL